MSPPRSPNACDILPPESARPLALSAFSGCLSCGCGWRSHIALPARLSARLLITAVFGARKATGRQSPPLHCVGPCASLRGCLAVLAGQGSPANSLRSNRRDRRASAQPWPAARLSDAKAQRQLPVRGFEGLVRGNRKYRLRLRTTPPTFSGVSGLRYPDTNTRHAPPAGGLGVQAQAPFAVAAEQARQSMR